MTHRLISGLRLRLVAFALLGCSIAAQSARVPDAPRFPRDLLEQLAQAEDGGDPVRFQLTVRWPAIAWSATTTLESARIVRPTVTRIFYARLDRPAVQPREFSGVGYRLNFDGSLWRWSKTKLFFVSARGDEREISGWSRSMRILRSGPSSLLLNANGALVLRKLTPEGLGEEIPLTGDLEVWRGLLDARAATIDPDYWFAKDPCSMMHRRTGKVTKLVDGRAAVSAKVGDLVFAVQDCDAVLIDVRTRVSARCRCVSSVVHASPLGILYQDGSGGRIWDPITGTRSEFPRGDDGGLVTWSPRHPDRLMVSAQHLFRRSGLQLYIVAPGAKLPSSYASAAARKKALGREPIPSLKSLVAQANAPGASENEKTKSFSWMAQFYGDRARGPLRAALARAVEEKDYWVIRSLYDCFAYAGKKEDARTLVAAGGVYAPASLARTLAILGDRNSLRPLRNWRFDITTNPTYREKRQAFIESIALLAQRPEFEAMFKRAQKTR